MISVSEIRDPASRFRLAQSTIGLVGCICVIYAVWSPRWLGDEGLWTVINETVTEVDQERGVLSEEVECVFAVLSFLMGLSSGILCLIFALCWSSKTVRSYSNTRSLLMVGQALYPTTLLLVTLTPTGIFFLLCWALFTHHHWTQISGDPSQLGSSYWLGAVGLILLLAVLPTVFLVEQCLVPDPLPELKKVTETWWRLAPASEMAHTNSQSHSHHREHFNRDQKRYTSLA